MEYDPYGHLIDSTLPDGLIDHLFTGQRWDSALGLYDYNARFYDPLIGSFTQSDSLVTEPMNPAAWNLFGYVYGNPVNTTDPSGHLGWDVTLDVAWFAWSAYDFYNDPSWVSLTGLYFTRHGESAELAFAPGK